MQQPSAEHPNSYKRFNYLKKKIRHMYQIKLSSNVWLYIQNIYIFFISCMLLKGRNTCSIECNIPKFIFKGITRNPNRKLQLGTFLGFFIIIQTLFIYSQYVKNVNVKE